MNEQEFIAHLTQVSEKFAKSIDDALTKTSLSLLQEPQEVVGSAQLSGLLMTAARRTARAKIPDIALFTALQEALRSAKQEVAELEAAQAKKKAATPPAKKPGPAPAVQKK